jgi:hypothetical protein
MNIGSALAKNQRKAFKYVIGLGAFLMLVGCGGGGGGSPSTPNPAALTLSTNQLTFTAASTTASVPSQVVSGTVTGQASGTLYVLVQSAGSAIQSVSQPVISGSNAQSWVTPVSPATLGPGTFVSQITVKACLNDPTCATGQISGSPATVNVTYQIDGLSISPSAANITTVEGSTSAPVNVQVNRLFGTQTWWTSATTYSAGTPYGSINVSPAGSGSLPATLAFSLSSSSNLTAGSYNATTTVTTGDGLVVPIPVNVTVEPKIKLSSSFERIVCAMGQSALPAPAVVNVTANGSETGYTYSLAYGPLGGPPGATGWLNVTADGTLPGTITIQPNTTALSVDVNSNATIYYAALTVTPSSGGTPSVLWLNYWVYANTLSAEPYTTGWSYVQGSGAAAPSSLVTLQSNLGSANWNGTVTYDSGPANGWLLAPASGTTGVASTFAVANPASLTPGFYRAHLTATAGTASLTVPFTLSVHPTGVNFVSPYGVATGGAGKAIIRGFGFTGATQVKFGATSATSFTVVNDTEIDAIYPATLAPGTYPVYVDSLATRANLVVVSAPAFSYTAIPHPAGTSGPVASLVYDAGRQTIYLSRNSVTGPALLEQFAFNGGAWTTLSSVSLAGTKPPLAITPDGASLLALSGTGVQIFALPAPLGAPTNIAFQNIPGIGNIIPSSGVMTSDGGLVGLGSSSLPFATTVYRFDTLLQAVDVLDAPNGVTDYMAGFASAPVDGSVVSFSVPGPPTPTYRYNANDGSFSVTPFSYFSQYGTSMNRNGSRLATSYQNYVEVIDFSTGYVLGYVTNATSMGAISPDGTRVYTFSAGFPNSLVHVFDVTKASNGVIPEIGTGTSIPDNPGNIGQIQVTPDGGSLIIAGDQMIIVMPSP